MLQEKYTINGEDSEKFVSLGAVADLQPRFYANLRGSWLEMERVY